MQYASRFEKQNTEAGGFLWRAAGIEARLLPGGKLVFLVRDRSGRRQSISGVFAGASTDSLPLGEGGEAALVSRYAGSDPSRWSSGVESYEQIRYSGLYPGVDLVFHTQGGVLEYDFEVAPRARLEAIRMQWTAPSIRLDRDGNLKFPGTALVQKRPRSYQWRGGHREQVVCDYHLDGAGLLTLGLGKYDRDLALTIDPVVGFGTGFGGQGFDAIYAVAVDSAGGIYVAGESDSGSFSASGMRSSRDAFVAKLNAAGTGLSYLTYLGGSDTDTAWGLAVDSAGNAYVTGATSSSNFPTSSGAYCTSRQGQDDAFVAKLSPAGAVLWSTYLGSAGSDEAYAIAIDSSLRPIVAGRTTATGFPVTSGAYQTTNHGGASECFVARLGANGGSLSYSTYLGGTGLDVCRGVAVDSTGAAYVTGTTYSTDFPKNTSYTGTPGGGGDVFVAKLDPTGASLMYSIVWGGRNAEEANAIAVDSSGAAYVAGGTASTNFPTTSGAYQTALRGSYDAFVTKIAAGGGALSYSTLLGGNGADTALAIGVDSSGQAVLAGYTTSTDLPMVSPLQGTWKGSFDAFAAAIGPSGATLLFSSYFGGSSDDRAFAVAALPAGGLVLAGTSSSRDMSPTLQAPAAAGGYDAFVMRVDGAYGSGLLLVPIEPCRVVDTRNASSTGLGQPFLTGGIERSFPIPLSDCGLPANAKAYSLNVTAVPRMGVLYYMTVFPSGKPKPWVSTLNSDGRVVANAAILPAGTGGAMSVYASDTADVILDVNGYFLADAGSAGLAFYSATPCRLVETRNANGPLGGPKIPGQNYRTFPLASSACLPQDVTPSAYALGITAMPSGPLGYLSVWPAGRDKPWVSTLNDYQGVTISNMALVPAGTGGAVNVFVTDTADLQVDAGGFFAPPTRSGALRFYPVEPCRVADTRDPTGTFGGPSLIAAAIRDFPIPAGGCGIPSGAQAYSMNVTAVPHGPLTNLLLWPSGISRPVVSTLSSTDGRVVANAAVVPAGANGALSVYVTNSTDVILDINGYFAP